MNRKMDTSTLNVPGDNFGKIITMIYDFQFRAAKWCVDKRSSHTGAYKLISAPENRVSQ